MANIDVAKKRMEFDWVYLHSIVFESQKRCASTALVIMLFSVLQKVKGVLSSGKLTLPKFKKRVKENIQKQWS